MPASLTKFLAAVALLLGCTAPLFASIEQYDKIQLFNRLGQPGGVFEVDDLTPADTPNFYTFCVEITEFINFNPNHQFKVGSLGTTTIAGNKTITSYTAWLYSSFLDQGLSDFNFNYTTGLSGIMSDVNALQLAIWLSLTPGYTYGYNSPNSDISKHIGQDWFDTYYPILLQKTWATEFAADVQSGAWSGLGGVEVMNLLGKDKYGHYTVYSQDQLVRRPPGPPGQEPVPEAASLVVWSLLVSCATIFARRRRS